MEKQVDLEKREALRLKKEIMIQYRIKEMPYTAGVQACRESFTDITRTKDLSEKGIFFTAGWAVPTQAILEIRLRLPTQREMLILEGNVLSCEKILENVIYGVRVEFINLNDEQRKTLKEFLQLFLKS